VPSCGAPGKEHIMARKKGKAAATMTDSQKNLDANLPVFQLKITLKDIRPPVWRRIQTHDCSLAELHEIIQFCMPWDDEHLYAFEIGKEQYSALDRGAALPKCRDSNSLRLSDLVGRKTYHFVYEYDFGDSWRHVIEIEETLPPEERVRYPRCLDGRRACPPEDCGGPWGYPNFLDAIQAPDHPDHEERLEWIGDEFDPERFDLEEMNGGLGRLRRWLGQRPPRHAPKAAFTESARVRVKRGVVHRQYPDLPLGGWVGTVARIAWLVPISYEIRWAPETLAAAHPVYAKRCRRDHENPGIYWLDEEEIELDSAAEPAAMEQPTELATRPLSAGDEDDRIRMVFGLTSDDPLPEVDETTERQYRDYLKARLAFPFGARHWHLLTESSGTTEEVTVVGFAAESPADGGEAVVCETRRGDQSEQISLLHLELDEDNPNHQYVEDYKTWWIEAPRFGENDEEDDGEDWDEEEWDEEQEDEDWQGDVVDDDDYGDDDWTPPIGLDDDLKPIRREKPPVGRNDPCPCGSGKKFKKCCLKKQGGEAF
jgi:hypothetical protein